MAVKIRLRRMGQHLTIESLLQIPAANVTEDVSKRSEHMIRTRSQAYARLTKKQLRNGLQTVLSLQKLLLRSLNRPESRNNLRSILEVARMVQTAQYFL